jgi:hypothetical protein
LNLIPHESPPRHLAPVHNVLLPEDITPQRAPVHVPQAQAEQLPGEQSEIPRIRVVVLAQEQHLGYVRIHIHHPLGISQKKLKSILY